MRSILFALFLVLCTGKVAYACRPDLLVITNNLAAQALNLARKSIQDVSAVQVREFKSEYRKADKRFSCPDTYSAYFTFSFKNDCVVKVMALLSPTESERGQLLYSNCDP